MPLLHSMVFCTRKLHKLLPILSCQDTFIAEIVEGYPRTIAGALCEVTFCSIGVRHIGHPLTVGEAVEYRHVLVHVSICKC